MSVKVILDEKAKPESRPFSSFREGDFLRPDEGRSKAVGQKIGQKILFYVDYDGRVNSTPNFTSYTVGDTKGYFPVDVTITIKP